VVAPRPSFSWSRQEVGRTAVSAVECLVVAARRETVEAGLEVLDEGGNAVDAAVCMAFVAAVVEPTEASIGGCGFMLVHDGPSGASRSVEFPPRAPLGAHADMYNPIPEPPDGRFLGTVRVRGDANATGPLAPCVPGVVAGLCLARERLGTLPLARLMAPAIEAAASGFEVDEYFTLQALAHLDPLLASPEAERVFLTGGLPPVAPFAAAADPPRVRQPNLAATLRAVAAHGPDGFYRGPIAEAIVRAFQEQEGLIYQADLDGYRAVVETPLERPYRGWSVLSPRAPCGGWTVLQALAILEHLPLAEADHRSAAGLHLMAEALQSAFADRYRLAGDADDNQALLEGLFSDTNARALAGSIRRDRASVRALPDAPWAAAVGHGTTHLGAIDADGRMVSCTITAGNTFGSKFMAAGTGVLFDSGMAWFDPRPGAVNSIAPGRRPLVNMAPLLLLKNGRPRLALGAAGGRRIISAVTQVVSAIVDHGLTIQDAISAPRLDASERRVRISDRLPGTVARELSALGHDVLTVAEQHAPFSYELARPAAGGLDEAGVLSGGIHPFSRGYVAGR
jgi:gamma-glutamyltranspeptidase / glutathione hydrolase